MMASKGKVKKGGLATGAHLHAKEKKFTRFQSQDEEKDAAIYKVLSAVQVKELAELPTVDDMHTKVAEMMHLEDFPVNPKSAALLDYYVGGIWWAREENYSNEQISIFLNVLHTLLENIKEKHFTICENLSEFKKLLTGGGAEATENSHLDVFDLSQYKAQSDFLFHSVFQHHKMYEYMFTVLQAEEIIGTDLEVEVAPDASLPWPPPLQEAVMENIYVAYITTPPPTPHTEEETETGEREEQTGEELKEAEREAEELMNQLTPEQIKNVIHGVMDEVVQGLQSEVVQKLRDKENMLIQRINKIHIVEKKVEV